MMNKFKRFDFIKHQTGPVIEDGAKKNYFSLFPTDETLNAIIPNSFIINQPMNGVGGDGYWLHQNEDALYLAVFDCMGHGHLASMMTRIYTNALNKVVIDEEHDFPNTILHQIHEEIHAKFGDKKNLQLGTGADFGIVKVNVHIGELEFAGAKMNLFEVVDGKFNIIKADKLQIGEMFDYPHEYTTVIIDLKKRTSSNFYLSSDGVRDLIGGPSSKKLGLSRLQELLEQVSSYSMEKQKEYISSYLARWKGSNNALDDILMIGFSI